MLEVVESVSWRHHLFSVVRISDCRYWKAGVDVALRGGGEVDQAF